MILLRKYVALCTVPQIYARYNSNLMSIDALAQPVKVGLPEERLR